MKVLLAHELFAPTMVGGGEKLSYQTAKLLKENGFQVQVLTSGNPKITQYEGIPTKRIPIHRYMMNFSILQMLKYGRKADIIHTHAYNTCLPGWLAGKILKKPVVCYVLGLYLNGWKDMKGPVMGTIFKYLEKVQVNRSYSKLIFPCNATMRQGLELGVPEKLATVIHPGTSIEKYKVGKKDGSVLFVGRLVKQKGLDYLIEAAKNLPDTHFYLAGKGPEEAHLRSIAPSNVHILGFVPDEEIIELYAKASIFCLSSIGEGFPLVIQEAMASGCAIVATTEIDYMGITVKPKDTIGLTNALKKLIEDKKLAEEYGKENRAKAIEYTWDNFAKKLIALYQELVNTS